MSASGSLLAKKNEYLRKLESFYQELGPRLAFDDTWGWPESSHDSLAKFVGNSAVETLDCGQ